MNIHFITDRSVHSWWFIILLQQRVNIFTTNNLKRGETCIEQLSFFYSKFVGSPIIDSDAKRDGGHVLLADISQHE